ncbi:peptidase M16 [Luteolibacter sp. LG18]|nr:peptidase M16 [Luteolibacter sp. LG18]
MVAVLGASAVYFQASSKNAPPPAPAPAKEAAPAAPADKIPAAPVKPEAAPEAPKAETSKAKPWPQEGSDIAADPKAVFGSLPNGFRYLIYPNAEPPGRVSLRLHIATGSLMEADDQQGLAHFLEHMVFNGSTHYKPDELVPVMQRLGIGFGAHVNAYTSFDQTVYMLDLPELSKDVLDLGFNVLRDFSDGALLSTEEIDKERGVILSEKVSRDSVETRLQEKQFAELLPGSLIANRFPIGKEDVISKAPRERFTDYYSRYYVPSRMTFIVVGDVDPAAMKQRIEESFGSMKDPEKPGKDPDLGPVKSPEGLETAVFTDKEVASTEVSILSVRPFAEEKDTVANRLKHLPLDVAHSMIARRFERLAKKENSPIVDGSASREEVFNHVELGSVGVTVADSRWEEAVPVLEQEFRRAMEHGFTEAELAEAKANLLNAYQQAVKSKVSRKSEDIASEIAKVMPEDEIFTTPETDLEIAKKGLDALSLEACHKALKAFWGDAGLHLTLTTKEAPEGAKTDLAAAYEESRGKPVAPPVGSKVAAFGYTSFGPAGKVVTTKQVADLGITQLVLSNNIRVNLKKTDFEKNSIRMLARIGSGQLSQPVDKPGLGLLASALFGGGGLGKHSVDDLEQILAGRNVGAAISMGEDAFQLSGRTTPEDLALQLQLACATLTDPGFRPEALRQFQKMLPMVEQQLAHTSAGPQTQLEAWLHGGDQRFVMPPVAKLGSYTIDDVKKWVTPDLEKGYLELSIVGDFDEDAIVPAVLNTFGALPKRAAAKPAIDNLRKVKFPNAPAAKNFTFNSKIPSAVAQAIWRTDGMRGNIPEVRRLNILADIYGDRLRQEIREKLGASYSPEAGAGGSDALDKYGYIIGEATAKPEDVDRLGTVMRELADKLAQAGANEDELARAKKPVLASLDKSSRDNSYWLATVLAQSQEDPKRLDLARQRDSDYRSITLKEINTLAKKYLGSANAINVGIKSVE